jgi:ankyrin repeat protein
MSTTSDLLQSIESGSVDRVREILEAAPDLARACDERGVSALLQARYRQRFDMVEAILEHRGDALDIFEAAALGDVGRIAQLAALDPRAADAFAPDGFTPLQLAAFFAQPEAVNLLLQRGANAELASRNPMHVRAIHSAAAGGSAEILERLLHSGASPNVRQAGGFTALHAAAMAGRLDMVRVLLAHGADPTLTTDEGKTAFDLATASGRAAVMQALRGEW